MTSADVLELEEGEIRSDSEDEIVPCIEQALLKKPELSPIRIDNSVLINDADLHNNIPVKLKVTGCSNDNIVNNLEQSKESDYVAQNPQTNYFLKFLDSADIDESELLCVRGASPTILSNEFLINNPRDQYQSESFSDGSEFSGSISTKAFYTKKGRFSTNQSRGRFKGRHNPRNSSVNDEENFSPTGRILQVCKFYIQGDCRKNDKCRYLHSEFPCKYHYLGMKCNNEKSCIYLHGGPLTRDLKNALITHIAIGPGICLGDFERLSRSEASKLIEENENNLLSENCENNNFSNGNNNSCQKKSRQEIEDFWNDGPAVDQPLDSLSNDKFVDNERMSGNFNTTKNNNYIKKCNKPSMVESWDDDIIEDNNIGRNIDIFDDNNLNKNQSGGVKDWFEDSNLFPTNLPVFDEPKARDKETYKNMYRTENNNWDRSHNKIVIEESWDDDIIEDNNVEKHIDVFHDDDDSSLNKMISIKDQSFENETIMNNVYNGAENNNCSRKRNRNTDEASKDGYYLIPIDLPSDEEPLIKRRSLEDKLIETETIEIIDITAENDIIIVENDIIIVENDTIAENDIMAENNDTTAENNDILSENNDIQSENNEIMSKNNDTTAENYDILLENNDILSENNEIMSKNNDIMAENNDTMAKNNDVVAENNDIMSEKSENNDIMAENNELSEKSDINNMCIETRNDENLCDDLDRISPAVTANDEVTTSINTENTESETNEKSLEENERFTDSDEPYSIAKSSSPNHNEILDQRTERNDISPEWRLKNSPKRLKKLVRCAINDKGIVTVINNNKRENKIASEVKSLDDILIFQEVKSLSDKVDVVTDKVIEKLNDDQILADGEILPESPSDTEEDQVFSETVSQRIDADIREKANELINSFEIILKAKVDSSQNSTSEEQDTESLIIITDDDESVSDPFDDSLEESYEAASTETGINEEKRTKNSDNFADKTKKRLSSGKRYFHRFDQDLKFAFEEKLEKDIQISQIKKPELFDKGQSENLLSFKPAMINYIPAKEIRAGLSSYTDVIQYQLFRIHIPPYDYTEIKKRYKNPEVSLDPRVKRMFQHTNSYEFKTTKQQTVDRNIPPTVRRIEMPPKKSSDLPTDPRMRKINSAQPSKAPIKSANQILNSYLPKSKWYASLNSKEKIQTNRKISILAIELNTFYQNPEREKFFVLPDYFGEDIDDILANLGIFIDEKGLIKERSSPPDLITKYALPNAIPPAKIIIPQPTISRDWDRVTDNHSSHGHGQMGYNPNTSYIPSLRATSSSASRLNFAHGGYEDNLENQPPRIEYPGYSPVLENPPNPSRYPGSRTNELFDNQLNRNGIQGYIPPQVRPSPVPPPSVGAAGTIRDHSGEHWNGNRDNNHNRHELLRNGTQFRPNVPSQNAPNDFWDDEEQPLNIPNDFRERCPPPQKPSNPFARSRPLVNNSEECWDDEPPPQNQINPFENSPPPAINNSPQGWENEFDAQPVEDFICKPTFVKRQKTRGSKKFGRVSKWSDVEPTSIINSAPTIVNSEESWGDAKSSSPKMSEPIFVAPDEDWDAELDDQPPPPSSKNSVPKIANPDWDYGFDAKPRRPAASKTRWNDAKRPSPEYSAPVFIAADENWDDELEAQPPPPSSKNSAPTKANSEVNWDDVFDLKPTSTPSKISAPKSVKPNVGWNDTRPPSPKTSAPIFVPVEENWDDELDDQPPPPQPPTPKPANICNNNSSQKSSKVSVQTSSEITVIDLSDDWDDEPNSQLQPKVIEPVKLAIKSEKCWDNELDTKTLPKTNKIQSKIDNESILIESSTPSSNDCWDDEVNKKMTEKPKNPFNSNPSKLARIPEKSMVKESQEDCWDDDMPTTSSANCGQPPLSTSKCKTVDNDIDDDDFWKSSPKRTASFEPQKISADPNDCWDDENDIRSKPVLIHPPIKLALPPNPFWDDEPNNQSMGSGNFGRASSLGGGGQQGQGQSSKHDSFWDDVDNNQTNRFGSNGYASSTNSGTSNGRFGNRQRKNNNFRSQGDNIWRDDDSNSSSSSNRNFNSHNPRFEPRYGNKRPRKL